MAGEYGDERITENEYRRAMGEKPIVRGPIDGNAFAVMGAVIRALKRAGQGDKVKEYTAKTMGGDYDNLLAVSQEYVEFDL